MPVRKQKGLLAEAFVVCIVCSYTVAMPLKFFFRSFIAFFSI